MSKSYVFSIKPSCLQYPAYVSIKPVHSIETETQARDYAYSMYGKAVDKVFAVNNLDFIGQTRILPFGVKIDYQDIDPDTGKVIQTISYYPGMKWMCKKDEQNKSKNSE